MLAVLALACVTAVLPVDGDRDGVVASEDCNDVAFPKGRPWPFFRDADGDGWGGREQVRACAAPDGYVARAGDCDDADADAHLYAAERCNNADDDCDGRVDDGLDTARWWRDQDGDGFGDDARPVDRCARPSGYVDVPGDCDDRVALVAPDGTETCDGRDEDCDGEVDEEAGPTWYRDADLDWYGDAAVPLRACEKPEGYVASSGDCDDGDEDVNPGAVERCDGVDDDCDGEADAPDCGD